ncbi:MAG: hypothetical protein AB1489_21445 [Acidobacteriota bacterium]
MDHELNQITQKVADFILQADEGVASRQFDRLALEVFEFQYKSIEPYRKLCQRQGKTPETVQTWSDIPAVPADAFKHFSLFAGRPEDVVKIFKSSGTTDPSHSSQAHFSRSGLELMNTAVSVNAARMLFPDGCRTRLLVLAPPLEQSPASIMVYGMTHLINIFGLEGSGFFVDTNGLKVDVLLAQLQQCQTENIPVTLIGSSFGFVHLFDAMASKGTCLILPQGSRLMDAGGYKGRSREIERTAFVKWACSMLGLLPERVVNLLGMTEMASQIYDNVLKQDLRRSITKQSTDSIIRMKEPPFWVRTQVIDFTQLRQGKFPLVATIGRTGLLRHLDLANVERPMMIQSEDVGLYCAIPIEDQSKQGEQYGFEILRRAKSAEPRGCSLSMEEFQQSYTNN